MVSRSTFGQIYDDGGNRMFNMNVARAGDDSSRITTIIYKDGPVYVLQMEGGKILNFSVDGRNVPPDGLGKYQAVIGSIKVRMKEAEEQAERDRVQARMDRKQADRDLEQAERDREQAGRDRVQAERDRQQSMLERDQEVQARVQEQQNRSQVERDREQADRDRQQAELDRQQAQRDRAQAERDRAQADRDRIRAEEDRKILDSLIRDLVADGIIPDRDSIHSIKLDADEVIVNGKRLPEAMEKKYLARYAKQGCSISMERG
jgi:multidrug efflux pump subunit AcrA (membrane-fusion protein)